MARDDHRDRIPELPRSPLTAKELDERWFRECERRWQAVQRGESRLIPNDEALKYIFDPAPDDE